MAKIKFYVRAQTWHRVRSRHVFEVDEWQVQQVLTHVCSGMNPLGATAGELLDYIDGRGEFALRVELAGAHKTMTALLERLAEILAHYEYPHQEDEVEIDDDYEVIGVKYEAARALFDTPS